MDPGYSDYDLSQDHPGYKLPVSNISYYVYPEESSHRDTEAVAQRAFKRIMDSYDEYEKLTEVFQVELDRRQQQAKERKEREKALREERQRQMKEEKKNRRLGKINHTGNNNNGAGKAPGSAAALLPPSRVPWHTYHPYRNLPSQQSALTASIMDLGRGLSHSATHKRNVDHLHGSAGASGSHSSQDPPPHLIPGTTFAGERSLSSSPVLPFTPSPQLRATSESAVGLDLSNTERTGRDESGDGSAAAAASTASSSSTTTPRSHVGSASSFLGVQQHPLGSQQSLRMRKKRKQAIPVHPSVVNRIPGITLRIQPDTEQQLQVEILKNVNDYCSRSTPSKSPGIAKTITDTDDGVEPMVGIIPQTHEQSNGDSSGENLEHQQELQAKQDMEKVLESIESGRPGYPFFPTAYLHQALEKELQSRESAEPCTSATATERLPDQKHCRQSSNASSRSLELHDPTGNRLPEWTEHQTLELVGSRVLLDEVVAARAQLPLSWDNFSTRDCQVNKVKTIGKQDKDLELLEEVVQETIARQHAVQMLSEDSDSGLNPNHPQGNEKAPNHRASNHRREREGSSASTSSPPAPPTSKYAATRSSTKKALETPPPVATPSRRLGARTTRGVTRGSARGSDETDHVLKQRRVMRRSEKQRHDSSSRASSQAADGDQEDQGHHEDEMGAEDRIPEEESGQEGGDEKDNRRGMSRRLRKSLNVSIVPEKGSTLGSHPASPPSPPHSRQVTPSKGESTSTSRRSSLASSRPRPFLHTSGPGSDTSNTPPATPTRATASISSLFVDGAGQSSGRTRTRNRSATSSVHPDGKNVFFDSALEMIEKKRKEHLAKKKAAAAAAAATAATAATVPDQQTMNQSDEAVKPHADLNAEVEVKVEAEAKSVDPDVAVESEGVNSSHQDKESVSAEHLQTANFDPHAMERELDSLASSRPSETTKANLPKSSKFLPGRVLRKGRIKDSDDPSENATSGEDLEMYDPDCTSCRLVLNAFDKVKWKQVQQAGDVQLNPKRWGKTAILCVACCSQFQKHHLRCTQCFYVPVIPEDVAGKTGAPKAGGTCVRCKAGTWLREN